MSAILNLRDNPRPSGALQLKGASRRWRLRVGNYRVLYDIFDADQLAIVAEISRRSSKTYKDKS